MNRKKIREGVIIVTIAIVSFFLAHNFYNDPLLKGGIELFGIPLYIIISFFILLYAGYRILYFIIKMVSNKLKDKK